MIRQNLYIPKYGWDVVVFYESDHRDAPAILKEMDEIGVDEYTYIKARANLRKGREDTGLTFTNPKERTSVIVLSKASTKAEFANTWFHEVFHCAVHIARECGLDYEGEAVAYVGGELARDMQHVAARLMCPTCK